MIRLNQSGLLFVPKSWQRAKVINWLKRIHAWTGFWGALIFLLMGASGFLLNHRDTLKIDTGKPVEVNAMTIAVAPGTITDADGLGRWAKQALGMHAEARPPRAGPGDGGRGRGDGPGRGRGERAGREGGEGAAREAAPDRRFMGRKLPEIEQWTRVFNLADGKVTVEYVPGASFVSAKREDAGALNTMKNLHKGVGLSVLWVLFIDTVAGALITMSLTGFLLWSRLHGGRLLAGGIVAVSLGVAVAGVAPYL
ncbi:PepSY-associated TM helix domain-containing protein [Sphingosinicellaceae bacterium]|nr:PepSY-associated TM helix domain-containing protein [Sphingosinicellaceae bacterium]